MRERVKVTAESSNYFYSSKPREIIILRVEKTQKKLRKGNKRAKCRIKTDEILDFPNESEFFFAISPQFYLLQSTMSRLEPGYSQWRGIIQKKLNLAQLALLKLDLEVVNQFRASRS